jgi:alkanesulfonate monooxygenase
MRADPERSRPSEYGMPVEVFSTCPQSSAVEKAPYKQRIADVARWSEQFGYTGILVYTDNSLVDPWHVSQIIVQQTESLCPLVAVQPVYSHPYTVAKQVTSLAHLHDRRVYLNMVAGGFTSDLKALNDTTPHDLRYERLTEYTTIIHRLLASPSPLSFEGQFYRVENLKLAPPIPPELFPGILLSGSSEAGLKAAQALGATAVHYPKPAQEYEANPVSEGMSQGIRVGIIAREDEETAWRVAHARFPEDRKGQLTHQLAMKKSDSSWHKQLSEIGEETDEGNPIYWLGPFKNYKTFCPYLVGSYERVAHELARYIAAGFRTFILDIPPDEEELYHTNIVFQRSMRKVAL